MLQPPRKRATVTVIETRVESRHRQSQGYQQVAPLARNDLTRTNLSIEAQQQLVLRNHQNTLANPAPAYSNHRQLAPPQQTAPPYPFPMLSYPWSGGGGTPGLSSNLALLQCYLAAYHQASSTGVPIQFPNLHIGNVRNGGGFHGCSAADLSGINQIPQAYHGGQAPSIWIGDIINDGFYNSGDYSRRGCSYYTYEVTRRDDEEQYR